MSQPTDPPSPLTPQFCFNTRFLRDFLRISRSQIDDSISTNLNALLTPSTSSPFTPTSTSIRSPSSALSRPPIPSDQCDTFLTSVLFPSWQSRSDVLSYCTMVSTSPDPDDPDQIEIEATNKKDAERVIDERLDPYSARFFPREPRTEMLQGLIRNELAVEQIIRRRTWGIVGERCNLEGTVGGRGRSWEEALGKWREERNI